MITIVKYGFQKKVSQQRQNFNIMVIVLVASPYLTYQRLAKKIENEFSEIWEVN